MMDWRIIEHMDELEQPDREDNAAGFPPNLEPELGDIPEADVVQKAEPAPRASVAGAAVVDLYTGPWRGPSNQSGVPATKGPVVIALKRTVSRARPDLLKWQGFDDLYNRRLEHALAVIQREHAIAGTGQTGEPTFRLLQRMKRQGHPHEPAMDSVAVNIFEDEWARKHPPVLPIEKVYEAIQAYWQATIAFASIWRYLQWRRMTTLGRAPSAGGRSDCSEMTTASSFWVRRATGIYIPDPNGRGYDGWGNSDTQWATNHSRLVTNGRYLIGDLGLYGQPNRTTHVVECIEAGTAATAVWGSNGSESAPNAVRLTYRGSDLVGVVRPILIPANH